MKLRLLALLIGVLVHVPGDARPDALNLRPARQPGDAYRLSVQVDTRNEASTGGGAESAFGEEVVLDYRADVLIRALDRHGRVVREHHQDVSLSFERPHESGSLFKEGVGFEVRRESDLRLFVDERRVDRRIEQVVAEVLDRQFEYSLESAMIVPPENAEVGDSWPLDRSLTRRFLLSHGVEPLDLEVGGTARLLREPDPGRPGAHLLAIVYEVPEFQFRPREMPERASVLTSRGSLEGRVLIAPGSSPGPVSARSSLALEVQGETTQRGTTAEDETRTPWSLERRVTITTSLESYEPPGASAIP